MIVIYKNYDFSESDAGKSVLLSNGQIAKIVTVIRECGNLYDIYGKMNDNILIWNSLGQSEDPLLSIVAIMEK